MADKSAFGRAVIGVLLCAATHAPASGSFFVASITDNKKRLIVERRKRGYGQPLPGPIGFIGAGKVGTALAALLHHRGAEIAAVAGRTKKAGHDMALGAGLSASVGQTRAG